MTTCPHENEVLAAVLSGHLPADIRAHAAECAVCGSIVQIATLVHDDFIAAKQQATVPSAEIVRLRAQMRAREEAARAAARPIILTQAIAIAALLGLLVSLAGRLSVITSRWLNVSDMPVTLLIPLGFAVATWLVFTPVALYFVFSRD
jgi:predicted anti-sigma-YlaC factor YlaD